MPRPDERAVCACDCIKAWQQVRDALVSSPRLTKLQRLRMIHYDHEIRAELRWYVTHREAARDPVLSFFGALARVTPPPKYSDFA